jgi:hypothetical protein
VTDRKKPGVAFWATVVVVAVLVAYPLSIGPACGVLNRTGWPEWARHSYWLVYAPILWIYENGPEPIHDAIAWYCHVWF